MSKHLPLPHIPKRRGQTRWERRIDRVFDSALLQRTLGHPKVQQAFDRLLDRPSINRVLGHPKTQRIFLGPEAIPALWGSLILIGAVGIAGFIGQIQWVRL